MDKRRIERRNETATQKGEATRQERNKEKGEETTF